MKNFFRSLAGGLGYGLLAGLWVLATEVVYGRVMLESPVRLEPSVLLLYAVVFGAIGLVAGLAAGVLRLSNGGRALLAGAAMGALVMALRVHDFTDMPVDPRLDGGLLLLAAGVAVVVGRLGRGLAGAAPAIALSLWAPALVLAAKIMVNTSAIPMAHPLAVGLLLVSTWPMLAAAGVRRVAGARAGVRTAAALTLVPAAVLGLGALRHPGAAASPASAAAAARSDAPPIIWVTIDTLRADHLSVYGYERKTTPNLEAFAKTATLYTGCGANAPSTWQSVPAMFTGMTPYRHGGVSETRRLPDRFTLVAEMLQERGYQTIGESANPWVSAHYGLAQGFEQFHLYNTDDELMLYDVMKLAMRVDPWQVFRYRDWLPSYAYVPFGTLVDEATDFVRARDASRPLFLYLQPVDPHGPYQAPLHYVPGASGFRREDYVSYWKLKTGVQVNPRQEQSLLALYDGAVTYSDAELGRLFDMLKAEGLYDKAMIIVTADHGEQFYDHALWRHGNSLYQALLHIPLVVKYPGQHEARVVNDPVASIDIAPTIMRELGGTCADCEGRALQDIDPSRPHIAYLMAHDEIRPLIKSVAADGWKLIQGDKDGRDVEQLFNVAVDPKELTDERATHPEVVARLEGLLQSYEKTAGPPPTAEKIELKPEETQRLRALGYVQ